MKGVFLLLALFILAPLFTLAVSPVASTLFTSAGGLVATIAGVQTAGLHEVVFDADTSPGGTYFYRVQTADNGPSKKLVMLK